MDTPLSESDGTQKPRTNVNRADSRESTDGSSGFPSDDPQRNSVVDGMSSEVTEQLQSLKLVSEPTKEVLNKKEVIDYRSQREQRAKWYLRLGKEPVKARGYSPTTLKSRVSNVDRFFRFVWDSNSNGSNESGYQSTISHDDADEYIQALIYRDVTDQYRANAQKSLKMLFKYQAYNGGTSVENTDLLWEPDVRFSQHTPTTISRDYFSADELREIRSTALSYGSPPHYNTLTPDKRDEWKVHLSQRYEIPKSEVGPSVFERADGFKTASLVCTSLDTGLRPVEVGRATTDWFAPDQNALHIPKQQGTKNNENWRVALKESTTELLAEWINEREMYEKYDDNDDLWLTKYSNPYDSQALSRLLRSLCEDTSIDANERQPTWYFIRRGVASAITTESNVHEAQMQLRHRSPRTTLRYVQSDTDARRKTLERL